MVKYFRDLFYTNTKLFMPIVWVSYDIINLLSRMTGKLIGGHYAKRKNDNNIKISKSSD